MTEAMEPDFFLPAIGDNNPPDMTATARETMEALSAWMAEHPVISTEEAAREAKVYVDRGKLCLKDLEDERDAKVRPLNEQVAEINGYYRGPREHLRSVLNEISQRMSAFLREEERKRLAAAAEARRKAEEAERIAREAEAKEREAAEAAQQGILGVDVAETVVQADEAFALFKKAERQAAIAEKDSKVRVGGGFTRALGLRTETILTVVDTVAAVKAIGANDEIEAAIIKVARAYHKLNGKYPPGIEVKTERKV